MELIGGSYSNGGNEMEHPLHSIVGRMIASRKFPDCKVIRDPACGGQQNIPLFCSQKKSNETEYCNVDILIVKDNRMRVIIEIEETDVSPTQICGKFLTSALSSHFIHESERNTHIEMNDSVLFVQIVNATPLKEGTSKTEQWKNLEKSIVSILPIKGSKIREYTLLYGNVSDFADRDSNKCAELVTQIEEGLK